MYHKLSTHAPVSYCWEKKKVHFTGNSMKHTTVQEFLYATMWYWDPSWNLITCFGSLTLTDIDKLEIVSLGNITCKQVNLNELFLFSLEKNPDKNMRVLSVFM